MLVGKKPNNLRRQITFSSSGIGIFILETRIEYCDTKKNHNFSHVRREEDPMIYSYPRVLHDMWARACSPPREQVHDRFNFAILNVNIKVWKVSIVYFNPHMPTIEVALPFAAA